MIRLALYDFDRTIYNGDTGLEVLKKLLIFSPKIWIHIPQILWASVRYICKIDNSLVFKENLYSYLCDFSKEEWEQFITQFWKSQHKKFFPLVKQQLIQDKKDGFTIGIISASPEILLYPIMQFLPADFLIGTIFATNSHHMTNKIIGQNCKNQEKINRLYTYMHDNYPNQEFIIEKMYSDSLHDLPLLQRAQQAITVESDGTIRMGFPKQNNNY